MGQQNTDPVNDLLRRIYKRAEQIENSSRLSGTFSVGPSLIVDYYSDFTKFEHPTASYTSYIGGLN